MKVILFGATGMAGQGALRECLLDGQLREIVRTDLTDLASIESELQGYDACFFCLGVSSAGILTLAVARTLLNLNPGMTFIYVSGAGTDSTEHGPFMWARVKGKTENDRLRLPFKAAYMFRPASIQPLPGVRSKTPSYRFLYAVLAKLAPVIPLLTAWLPRYATTTERLAAP